MSVRMTGSPFRAPFEPAWKLDVVLPPALFALAALVFSWPLAAHLSTAIPAGSGPPTVALFNLFTIEWTGRALEEGHSYWDAPIFHPHRGTFAWSEPQPLTSLAAWVVSKGVGVVASYNLVLLAYVAAAGVAGYALARQVTADRIAATWAGLWIAAGTYPIQEIGVLHLIAAVFPLACLALATSLARGFSRWSVWGAGLALFLTFTSCAQYGLFLTMLLPLVLGPAVAWRRWRWSQAAMLLLALGAGVLLASPFLLSQRSRLAEMGFSRTLMNVRGAYVPVDLVTPARGHWLAGRLLGWSSAPDAYPHDVGVVPLLFLAAAAAAGVLRRRSSRATARGGPARRPEPGGPAGTSEAARRRTVRALLVMTGVALLLGVGPNLGITIGGEKVAPYAWLHAVVPGLDGVRTPSRFAMFASAGVATLGAAGFASLRSRMPTARSRTALSAAGFALLLAEMWAAPIALVDPEAGIEDHREVIEWLRSAAGGTAVLEVPMAAGDSEADLEREVRAMLRAIRHSRPIANGYSGYLAETYRQVRSAAATDLAGRGLRYLRALGVGYVLVHEHDIRTSPGGSVTEDLGGDLVFRTEGDSVVRLDVDAAAAPARPPATTGAFPVEPRDGDILRFPIEPSKGRARLLVPSSGQVLRCVWPDASGAPRRATFRLRGAVLVDAGARWFHVEVRRPAEGDEAGEAVLISQERVAGRGVSG